jgi:hypothetical protein
MGNLKDKIDVLIASATLLGLISTALLWYRTKVEKSYAAQRDFNHLRNAIATLSESINKLVESQQEESESLEKTQEKILTKLEILPFLTYRDRTGWTSTQNHDEGPPTGPL